MIDSPNEKRKAAPKEIGDTLFRRREKPFGTDTTSQINFTYTQETKMPSKDMKEPCMHISK